MNSYYSHLDFDLSMQQLLSCVLVFDEECPDVEIWIAI